MRQTEPTIIAKGERVEWGRAFSGFPSDEWTLQYRFRGPGPGFDVDATADTGSGFTAEITAAQSLTVEPLRYAWQAWVTNIADTAVTEIAASGQITFSQGFVEGDASDNDLRSPARVMLDSIDAALLAFSGSDVQEYEISTPAGSRRVKRSDKAWMTSQRSYWAGIVSRENAAERLRNGSKFGKQIKVSMRER